MAEKPAITSGDATHRAPQVVGTVPVDSGQIIVIDPCYLDRWHENPVRRALRIVTRRQIRFADRLDYSAVCTVTLSRQGCGQVGPAVATSTGYGDGEYLAAVERNEEGRIMRLIVEFNGVDWAGDGDDAADATPAEADPEAQDSRPAR